MPKTHLSRLALAAAATAFAGMVFAHGDVAPQPVNTDALPDVGEEWLTENPYRGDEEAFWTAVEIGASGYNQNCARCHGLEVISGGLAPDLRFLEAEEYGDEWYMERFIHGYTQNGITKMPAFGELLGQKAAWAIRSYIETRPDDAQMADLSEDLKVIRDTLQGWADAGAANPDSENLKEKLAAIAAEVETLSGAPVADSVALRAAKLLDGSPESFKAAAETLTIGLSAAH